MTVTIASPRKETRAARREGSTLVELSVVVAVTGIMASFAVPSFRRAVEQAHVDQAAANVRTIWAAERFYWLDHKAYTTSLEDLYDAGLIEAPLASGVGPPPFSYEILVDGQDPTKFTIQAERLSGTCWAGALTLDQDGVFDANSEVSGDGLVIRPAYQLRGGSP